MAGYSAIRNGIAANLSSAIPSLRVHGLIPDQINPPAALVRPSRTDYDQTMGRGLDEIEMLVLLIVGRMDDRSAQLALDAYCDTTGTSSVKRAIESNRTLSGVINDLRVTQMRNYGPVEFAGAAYLGAEFVVSVYA